MQLIVCSIVDMILFEQHTSSYLNQLCNCVLKLFLQDQNVLWRHLFVLFQYHESLLDPQQLIKDWIFLCQ